MKIKFFRKDVKMPIKSHLPDSGLDLFIPEEFELDVLETKTLGLGLGFAIPEGFAGMLVPRSSIADKGLVIQTAVIDPDYTGEIHLIITNCSNKKVKIEKNQRVCSLIVYNVLNMYLEVVDDLPKTERNDKGLGSTGK
jgi:dUTP pyrophosphatase